MASHGKPAYVPFFEDTLLALSNLSAEDVCSYVKAIRAYVYDGIEPTCAGDDANCTGAAMAVFAMGRYQLDKTLKRSATNRANARARRTKGQTKSGDDVPSETETNGEQTESETAATAERETCETVANGERTASETVANGEQLAIYSNIQIPNTNTQENPESSSSSSSNAPPHFEVPSLGDWIAYFNAKCTERGIPPSSEAAERAWGYYEDHGWCHRDGSGFKNWHRQCSTCVTKHAKDQGKRTKGGIRHGNRNRASGHFSNAARDYDERAECIDSLTG